MMDRRQFLHTLASSALTAGRAAAAPSARSVIWLFMEGGPSAVDTFDPKPELKKHHGKRPKEAIETFFGRPGPLMQSPFSFQQHGGSGLWVCDRMPAIARHADELAVIKSCFAESPNHSPAMYQMNTGMTRAGFPSVGSWVTYGLGTDNKSLPGFVVFPNEAGSKGGPQNWGHGFLPGTFQATPFRTGGAPILNLSRPSDVGDQRALLDYAQSLNRDHRRRHGDEPDLEARMHSHELAYRMQSEGRKVADLTRETDETRRLYGIDRDVTRPFGSKCLMARRLVESGVRFVQLYSDGEWDSHGNLAQQHGQRCDETDVPIAGLLTDLKRCGLLDSTLVIWGGEFGRMPVSEQGQGRDHNPHGFLVWMAGAGIKAGVSHGETDELGYRAAVNPVSVNDLHATMLHLLGLDHRKLTYLHNGRRFRLTDVAGEVIRPVLS